MTSHDPHVDPPEPEGQPRDRGFIVADPRMRAVAALAERAGRSDAKVLITGESGAGKDLVARHVHACSKRRAQKYVAVNCGGLAESLLESELFGHVKGSFTGAIRDKPGKVQLADRGTLFLDEVGEMSLRMQAMLLRFLESGEVQTVGSDAIADRVDVRIIAATNRNLAELVAAGQFREDLLYRLRVIHIEVPPLRDRPSDIRRLVAHFIERVGRRVTVTEEAYQLLERYRWPGNVRELQNIVEQTLWLADTDVVAADHLPAAIRTVGQSMAPLWERRRQVADQLYEALVVSGYSFWQHIHPLFLARDVTRHDIRDLVRRGLATTHGNYRALLKLFGIPPQDYKRFLNFLSTHECRPDFREFRAGTPDVQRASGLVLPPLPPREEPEPVAEPGSSGP